MDEDFNPFTAIRLNQEAYWLRNKKKYVRVNQSQVYKIRDE